MDISIHNKLNALQFMYDIGNEYNIARYNNGRYYLPEKFIISFLNVVI